MKEQQLGHANCFHIGEYQAQRSACQAGLLSLLQLKIKNPLSLRGLTKMSAQSSLWACNAHGAMLLLVLPGKIDSSGFPFLSAPGETEWRVCVVPPAFYFAFF